MPRQSRSRPIPTPDAAPKSKAVAKKRAWDELNVTPADFLSDQVSDSKARNGGVLLGNEAERVCIGLPLKAFSLQYLHSSDVYPLGRMDMHIGESDSCKSAYAFEKMRWFLREDQSAAVYLLNESRDPAELRASIIGKERLGDGRFKLEGPCASLEDWQRKLTWYVHRFEEKFKSKGCAFPVNITLDSLTGTTNENVIASIDELGHAKIGYGQDANLINTYAKYLFQRLYKFPIALVTTNHIKYGSDSRGNRIMKIPGGDELRYVSTYISHLKKVGKDIDRLDVAGGRLIEVTMMKSMGDHRSLQVEFSWVHENGEMKSTWNWHAATVTFLAGFTGERRKLVDEVVNFPGYTKSSKSCACPAVGIKKNAPFDVVGQAIMADAKVLKALQDLFGVKRRRAFQVGVPYDQQIAAAIAAGDTETHNSGDVDGAEAGDGDAVTDDGIAEVTEE